MVVVVVVVVVVSDVVESDVAVVAVVVVSDVVEADVLVDVDVVVLVVLVVVGHPQSRQGHEYSSNCISISIGVLPVNAFRTMKK